jgi:transcriptional repressor NrdR
MVMKRLGGREAFDLEKVRSGLERALGGRPLPPGAMESLLQKVEATALESGEIASDEIGRIVLEGLKEIDEVAYLRFASVYKDFEGAQDFERELAALDD